MNVNNFLNEALQAIECMPVEEFEAICFSHGYTPVRKKEHFINKQDIVLDDRVSYQKIDLVYVACLICNDNAYSLVQDAFCDAA